MRAKRLEESRGIWFTSSKRSACATEAHSTSATDGAVMVISAFGRVDETTLDDLAPNSQPKLWVALYGGPVRLDQATTHGSFLADLELVAGNLLISLQ